METADTYYWRDFLLEKAYAGYYQIVYNYLYEWWIGKPYSLVHLVSFYRKKINVTGFKSVFNVYLKIFQVYQNCIVLNCILYVTATQKYYM